MSTQRKPQLLTHSRLSALRSCPRRHYYRYELGLSRIRSADALRLGAAYHAGLEARNAGQDEAAAIELAAAGYAQLPQWADPIDWAVEQQTLRALLAGHFWRYGQDDLQFVAVEQSFQVPLLNPGSGHASRLFLLAGKIDAIVLLPDGRLAVLEYKTAGEDLSPDSDYWLRLRCDPQISLYVLAARTLGFDVATVLYDVTRKPTRRSTRCRWTPRRWRPNPAIHRGRRPAPRRCMIHGVQGVGKSSWAASSDQPIFIQTEDGLGEIDCAAFPLARSFAEVMEALTELRNENHEFRTAVIDSLDWLERLIWQEVCQRKNVANIEDIGFQKGYAFALDEWRMFIDALDTLRREKGMAVILIAHTKVEKFQTPEDSAFDRFSPRLHKLAAAVVMEWCDEVFFATYSTSTDPKKVKNVEPERIIRTSEGPTHVAKKPRAGQPLARLPGRLLRGREHAGRGAVRDGSEAGVGAAQVAAVGTAREAAMKANAPKKSGEVRGIECPKCGCRHFEVVYTRASAGGKIIRRRQCRHCGRNTGTILIGNAPAGNAAGGIRLVLCCQSDGPS